MPELQVQASRPYSVHIGPGVLRELTRPKGPVAILTDGRVAKLHLERLAGLDADCTIVVSPGEESKSFGALERVLNELARAGLDRSSTLVALGGGVVGDLGGLAASLYMRGIDLIHCPTTLLAMVDSSIGGKTAVNLASGKNLAGSFKPPLSVHADIETLATLDPEELQSGFGEVLKSALIGDPELLDWIEDRTDACRAGASEVLAELVARCAAVKARVVGADEEEGGSRKVLNLGHTFAHAIEQVAGYGRVPHGLAVGVGLVLALRASQREELLEQPELIERIPRLLGALELPESLDALRARSSSHLEPSALMAAMRLDKKSRAGRPHFVLVRRAGQVEADHPLEEALVEALLASES